MLRRPSQHDEYVALIPRAETSVETSAGAETTTVEGDYLFIVRWAKGPSCCPISLVGGGSRRDAGGADGVSGPGPQRLA